MPYHISLRRARAVIPVEADKRKWTFLNVRWRFSSSPHHITTNRAWSGMQVREPGVHRSNTTRV
ncbi:hypothetical protein EYF80_055575 [Liparis tanakae]|uniref:Uncharacterized protein n=1 Tax=Liparis tanakae TaxID=230148 RepID=A0A4Z2F0H3_9TELE|nr:hypothetical protein EYF80_055575 [Liparis tanakae]